MPRPYVTIDRIETPDGPLELRKRGSGDYMILHAGNVLMTSQFSRSEVALAKLGCAGIANRPAPRVLTGGAGLGYTLRAALDLLPSMAQVTTVELNAGLLRWCHGPLAELTGGAFTDPRVTSLNDDVMRVVPTRRGPERGWDAILVDLYVGPTDATDRDPLYGVAALASVARSLNSGGTYAVWSENGCSRFERRLARAGFEVRVARTERPGPQHFIFLATKR